MKDCFKIVYAYRFEKSEILKFEIMLDPETLLAVKKPENPPEWTLLERHKCRICPLEATSNKYCPVAAQFSTVVEKLKRFVSLDKVDVACIVEERTYTKTTTLHMGLSPLLGVVMTTSGCPIMDQLKPMVRFHLPFASVEETIFRMVSMHLVSQYLRKVAGKPAEFNLDGLLRIYDEVAHVNRDFATRLSEATQTDVNVNALVNLDAFAKIVPLAADAMLKKITPYFSSLLQ